MTIIGEATGSSTFTVDGETLRVRWGSASDTGLVRAHNEDSLVAEFPVFAVADGMGGHAAGDVASGRVVTRLGELAGDATTPHDVLEALRRAVGDLDGTDPEEHGGSTVTGIALVEQEEGVRWAVFNIGDSRVYAALDGSLVQITDDHSVVQEMVRAGIMTAEDAENHPESNVVTRAVGFGAEPVLDVWIINVEPEMRFLVCSDGLTREVSDSELERVLAVTADPAEAARMLVDAANEGGGRDNITVIVLDVDRAATESDD